MADGETFLNCPCESFSDLELSHADIDARECLHDEMCKNIKQIAQRVYERNLEHFKLYMCETCGQYWQSDVSWKHEKFFLYKVPKIIQRAWKARQYVSPDEILSYNALIKRYIEGNSFDYKGACVMEGCSEEAITGLGCCLSHQIATLQKVGALPRDPVGIYFEPYSSALLYRP